MLFRVNQLVNIRENEVTPFKLVSSLYQYLKVVLVLRVALKKLKKTLIKNMAVNRFE